MNENNRRRLTEGNQRSGNRSGNQRMTGHLRDRVGREWANAAERGLNGVPIAEETQPAYRQFILTGFDELMLTINPEVRLPEATGNLEDFTGNLARETGRRSLTAVTLAVFTAVKDRTCPLWPFC